MARVRIKPGFELIDHAFSPYSDEAAMSRWCASNIQLKYRQDLQRLLVLAVLKPAFIKQDIANKLLQRVHIACEHKYFDIYCIAAELSQSEWIPTLTIWHADWERTLNQQQHDDDLLLTCPQLPHRCYRCFPTTPSNSRREKELHDIEDNWELDRDPSPYP